MGLHANNNKDIRVVRLRGNLFNQNNDTPITRSNFVFKNKPSSDAIKFLELILSILYTPLSVFIEKFRHDREIIILYDVEYSYKTIPFLVTSKILGLKIFRIVTDHYDDKILAPVWWKKIKLLFYNIQLTHFDKYFDGLVVVSYYLKNLFIKNGIDEKRILLTPHYINLSTFKIPAKQPTETLVLGFCGNTSLINGIIDLLECYKIIENQRKDTHLLIIGRDNEFIRDFIKRNFDVASQLKIKITGFLNKEEVLKQLSLCDILVNPRKSSQFSEAGFPTKLGEYFATSKPVVSTATGDLRHYFLNSKCLVLSEPDNPALLAKEIIALINDKERADRTGLNGYRWAQENLDYIVNAKKLNDFIEIEH